jgi:chemotaxis protein histidine kinase CheA
MAKARKDEPAVKTYEDHEVIEPPHKLKKAVVPWYRGRGEDPVARADAALAQLSDEFSTWMQDECERLDKTWRRIRKGGATHKKWDDFFRAAHDIKGGAGTFGFAHAGEVADSLCRLIEHTPDMNRVPHPLIDQHVDAIRAIVREAKLEHAGKTASELAIRLREVADLFLAQENRERPNYLESLTSPPLAPTDGF